MSFLHSRKNNVCDPLQHGPRGFPTVQDRHPADRLGLRGGLHAYHDPHGGRRPAGSRGRELHQVSALCGAAAASRRLVYFHPHTTGTVRRRAITQALRA